MNSSVDAAVASRSATTSRPPRRVRRACAVCDDPHRSGAPVACARCQLVHYCSKAHRGTDAARHQPLCASLSTLREQLRRQQRGLRGQLSEYVGLYWGFYEARGFLRTKTEMMHVYRRMATPDAREKALEEALDLLRLARADPMAVRYVVPALLLQLGRVQACYDFIKWWAVALADENYSFRAMEMPFLSLEGADMTESIAFVDVLSLPHSLAFVVVKLDVWRLLWEAIQAERMGRQYAVPTPVVRNIQGLLGCSEAVLSSSVRHAFHRVRTHVVEMIKRAHELNRHVWEAVLDPQKKILDGRTPDGFAAGSKDEARVTLEVWLDVLLGVQGLRAAVRESGVMQR